VPTQGYALLELANGGAADGDLLQLATNIKGVVKGVAGVMATDGLGDDFLAEVAVGIIVVIDLWLIPGCTGRVRCDAQ
jgi:hypothetical protein